MDMTLTLTSSLMGSMNSKRELLMLFEGFCIIGYREFYKKLLCILAEWTRPYMEIMKMFQTNFWTLSFWVVQESEIIWIGKWEPLIPCSHSLIKASFTNRNSSSTTVWPNHFNISCSQCLQCHPFMTNLELDGIESILTITSKIISKLMKWVMWYNKKKIYNTITVWTGSHSIDDND